MFTNIIYFDKLTYLSIDDYGKTRKQSIKALSGWSWVSASTSVQWSSSRLWTCRWASSARDAGSHQPNRSLRLLRSARHKAQGHGSCGLWRHIYKYFWLRPLRGKRQPPTLAEPEGTPFWSLWSMLYYGRKMSLNGVRTNLHVSVTPGIRYIDLCWGIPVVEVLELLEVNWEKIHNQTIPSPNVL